ncbi:MAG: hypothetical protein SPL39_06755 [Selenomonadaceae bacterium]|nr:hypothetical protein [Selenomonadaceae bacterium]
MENERTRLVRVIPVEKEREKKLSDAAIEQQIQKAADEIEKGIEQVQAALEVVNGFGKNQEIRMDSPENVIYQSQIACLTPQRNMRVQYVTGRQKDYRKEELSLRGMEADYPSRNEAEAAFPYSNTWLMFNDINYAGLVYKADDHEIYCYGTKQHTIQPIGIAPPTTFAVVPFVHLNGRDSKPLNDAETLLLWWKYRLLPEERFFNAKAKIPLYKKIGFDIVAKYPDFFYVAGRRIVLDRKKLAEAVRQGKRFDFLPDDVPAGQPDSAPALDAFCEQLLHVDELRAALDPYDPRLLTDEHRGHWDLWDMEEPQADDGKAELGEGVWARNSSADVHPSFVAIDFGTKSTVVVYENEHSQRLPLQVGSGHYRNAQAGADEDPYENPTILELRDIDGLLAAYRARAGRPATRWEQIRCSHAAKTALDHGDSRQFYSFFTDLKQWCTAGDGKRLLRDQRGKIVELSPFLYLDAAAFNPVEVYAYYLGCYMNNMYSGIYLHYILSFPVTYDIAVRERIRRAFEAGLKKSLPTALLANEAAMKSFSVLEGVTEPAAYAVTALQSFGFEPEDGEATYYAVFDFGGGTADFDYGVLHPSERDRYDDCLTHFGANGDRTLGGENLLRLLAFAIFRENRAKLLDPESKGKDAKKITFTYAAEPEAFLGSEALIRDSQEAKQNMHNLMEAVRVVWEHPESAAAKDILQSARVTVPLLYLEDGTPIRDVTLSLAKADAACRVTSAGYGRIVRASAMRANTLDLSTLLRERIAQGVRNFFFAMRQAFAQAQGQQEIAPLAEIDTLHIFLAGNASRSPLVREAFDAYLSDGQGTEALRALLGLTEDKQPTFKLHPPLGTSEAQAQQPALAKRYGSVAPTAKTGVAFGLLECRPGGSVEVIDLLPDGAQVPFQFYVGRRRRGKFQTVIAKDTPMDHWYKFIDAGDVFDLFYTDQPEAATNTASVEIAKKRTVTPAYRDADAFIWFRPIDAHTLEYRIAKDEAALAQPDERMAEPVRIVLD